MDKPNNPYMPEIPERTDEERKRLLLPPKGEQGIGELDNKLRETAQAHSRPVQRHLG